MISKLRRILLARRITQASILLMAIWGAADLLSDNPRSALSAAVSSALFGLVLLLFKLKFDFSARFAMILALNAMIFPSAFLFQDSGGGAYPYIVLSALSWVAFDRRERWAIYLSSSISFLLFLASQSHLTARWFARELQSVPVWHYWGIALLCFLGINFVAWSFKALFEEERELQLDAIIKTSLFGIFIGRRDGLILKANDVALAMLGYTQDELQKGHFNLCHLSPPEQRDATIEQLNLAKRTGRSETFEKEYLHKDGHRVPVIMGFASVDPQSDEFLGFILDLSKQKQTESALQALGDLSAIASHEIKTPLTSLCLLAGMLQKTLDSEPENLPLLQKISRGLVGSAMRTRHLSHELMDLRKAGHVPKPTRSPVDLSQITERLLEDFRAGGMTGCDRIRFSSVGSLIGAWDRTQLEQVVSNLVSNAIRYGRSNLIEVSVKEVEEGRAAELRVTDEGPGVAPEMRERIFEKYERAGLEQVEPSGMGIGLYVVKNIVLSHGGSVRVEGEKGKGASFVVKLPKGSAAC